MSADTFLANVNQSEVTQLTELLNAMLDDGVRSAPLMRRLDLKEDLDPETADKDDLNQTKDLGAEQHQIERTMRSIYEAQRARRDINIGRAGRLQRLVSALSTLNALRSDRQFDLDNG